MKKVSKKQYKLKKNKGKASIKRTQDVVEGSNAESEIENEVMKLEDSCDTNESEHMEDVHVAEKDEQTVSDSSPKKKKKIKGKSEHRSEASQTISEFNLLEVGKERVKLDDLIKSASKGSGPLNKQLKNAKKFKSLSVPLSKPQLEKIKRTIAYNKVCNEVSKWDTIVKSNRDAEQIIYPLKRPEFHLESLDKASERFITKHPVEEAVSKLLQTSENVLDPSKTLTVAEEKALNAMSLEQAKERHKELMRHKALISYEAAKAKRQSKIKSKKYHRLLKRDKLKEMLKEFEQLQEVDKKAALEKFLDADKLRILERMTLKHRNTGKWAKQQKIRAKYNPESRDNLKEDLDIGRQLRKKIEAYVPDQFEMTNNDVDDRIEGIFEDNAKICSNLKKDLHIGHKFQKNADTPAQSEMENFHADTPAQSEMNVDENPEERFFETNTQEYLIEGPGFGDLSSDVAMSLNTDNILKSIAEKVAPEKSKHSKEIALPRVKETIAKDQIDFSEPEALNSLVPGDNAFEDEHLDDDEEGIVNIDQVLDVDDEVINEFRQEKKIADRANKPQGIDNYLPGWGSWGGPGIKVSRKKKRRFFIKPLEQPQPIKNTLGNVIINEEKDMKAAVHQVSHLPFPFTNIHQFESYIRQPIGNTWNPQSSFQNLIAPKVVTKMGKIIDPIDPDDVMLEKKTTQAPLPKRKKRGKTKEELKAF